MPKRKKKTPDHVEETPEQKVKFVVYAPGGACPFQLKTSRQKDIRAWMEALSKYGLDRDLVYTRSAYLYYAQYFFPRFTKQHKKVEKFINKCYIDLGLDDLITNKNEEAN